MESLGPRQGVSLAALMDMTDHRTVASVVKFSKQAEPPATRQPTCWTMDRLQLFGLPPLAWHPVGVRILVSNLYVSHGREHVCNAGTNAYLDCRLLLKKKKT